MVSSPYLVIYAECLLLLQYIYGMNLNDKELPTKKDNVDYAELGLKKFSFPCLHLGAQVRFFVSPSFFLFKFTGLTKTALDLFCSLLCQILRLY